MWEAQIWGCISLVILSTLIRSNKSLGVLSPPRPGTASSSAAKFHKFISGHINIWCFSQSLSSVSQVIMSIYQLSRVRSHVLATALPFQAELKYHGERSKTCCLTGEMSWMIQPCKPGVLYKHIAEAVSHIHPQQGRKGPRLCSCSPPGDALVLVLCLNRAHPARLHHPTGKEKQLPP